MLCDDCESLCCDVLTGDIRNSKWVSNSLDPHVLEFAYENSEALIHNAYTGSCDLCLFFHRELDSLSPHQLGGKKKISIAVSPFADLNKFWPWQLYFKKSHERYAFFFSSQSERVPETFNTLDVEIAESVKRYIGFMSSRYSGSDTVCALAAHWSSLCATEHSKCRGRKRDMPFPTRLIDIGERDNLLGWTQPRIVSTKGRFVSYVTLSYRWSRVGEQFVATKENMEWLMRSIRLDLLPKTISEAITFSRQLGLRYLWVDSLCIVQNDDDDWRRECGKMASIFQNSHLTISALHARDSHAGLFHHRTPPDLRFCLSFQIRDGTKLVLRSVSNMPELQWEVDASAMGSRGWIMQERLLSPTIIHFGDHQLHWECVSCTISENYPNTEGPVDGVLKNFMVEVQRPGINFGPSGHFITWYMMIQYYSGKSFTMSTDFLPGLLGLANRFETEFSTTFAAGLWLEDFHRGLLWTQLGFRGSKTLGSGVVVAPSWSWIKLGGRIGVNFELDDTPTSRGRYDPIYPQDRMLSPTDAQFIDVEVRRCSNIHRSAIRGAIEIWGTIVRAEGFPHTAVEPEEEAIRRRYILQRKRAGCRKITSSGLRRKGNFSIPSRSPWPDNIPRSGLNCNLDLHSPEKIDCYCLVIADWRFENSYKGLAPSPTGNSAALPELRCYLILQRVRSPRKNGHPLDLGVFERIGMRAASIEKVEGFFSIIRPEKEIPYYYIAVIANVT